MNDSGHNGKLIRLLVLAEKPGVSVHCIRNLVLSVTGIAFATTLIYAGLAMFFGANVWDYKSKPDNCSKC
ncbi:MAG: hypothetical protein V3V22_00385 [Methylococcales bacterium]